ncbi:ankyrin repeat-containing domain protein [Chaetomium fimeti]|uniref:Ankyrin repeat-containing domain protein n=1 Tax=Chaetomium fimeti TaxID=1854472 RepID=A0AAE0HN65_9PEZI|nr:ankyrin repeat-containing domain protein [Chaetomium fimeti]
MATLASLPNELLYIICNYLYPPNHCWEDEDDDIDFDHAWSLLDLHSLSSVNHRFLTVIEPILYAKGLGHHFATPLAWAAKRGYAGTLHKALAAGASPDRKLRCQMTREYWHFINDTRQAARDWAAGDPKYWPAYSEQRVAVFEDNEECWARDMSPGLTDYDVRNPAHDRLYIRQTGGNVSPDDSNASHAESPSHDRPPELYESDDELLREYTALHIAAGEGHTDLVNLLLANGASVDSSSRWFCPCRPLRGLWQTLLDPPNPYHVPEPVDWPPLHAAICSSRIETAKTLLSAGIKGGKRYLNGPAGYGALHQAAAAGHADLVGYILDIHPELDVDAPDDLGLTPFYHAYTNARWDSTVPLLLARGANINSRFRIIGDDRREHVLCHSTPLGEACRLGRFEDAVKLLDLGADVNLGIRLEGDPADCIPLLHLCCMDFSGDDEFFPENEVIWSRAPAQRASRAAVIARIVASGISPDGRFAFDSLPDETALSVAVRYVNLAAVEALLAAGADVGARDSRGRNALMVSVERPTSNSSSQFSFGYLGRRPQRSSLEPLCLGSPQTVHPDTWIITKLLIEAGTNLADGDEDGNTVLHHLFDRLYGTDSWIETRSDIRALQLLLARGADLCLRNNRGVSALHVAVRNRRLWAVETIAKQSRIDLVEAFPMPEIGTLFDAVPLEDHIRKERRDPNLGHVSDLWRVDNPTVQLLDALVNMDRSGRLSSDVAFICSRLHNRYNEEPALELAEILCFRGLEAGSLDGEAKLTILRAAIKVARWEMARALLREIPKTDINAPDPDGHTLLSLVTSSNRTSGGDFAWQLIEAGADIHARVRATLIRDQDRTPLKQAFMRPGTYPIARMLQKQPIRGNPRAIEERYLHWAVTLPWNTSLPSECSRSVWVKRDNIIRALLVAGADPAQLDSNDDTPLSRAATQMRDDGDVQWDMSYWVKPLSRGVDVHRKNKQGRSVVDYLGDPEDYWEYPDIERIRDLLVENGETDNMEM